MASVKIKIATVEYLPLFAPTKKNRAGDLKKNLKKNPTEAADVKKNPTSTSPLSLFLWSVSHSKLAIKGVYSTPRWVTPIFKGRFTESKIRVVILSMKRSHKANQTKLCQAVMQERARKLQASGRWIQKHVRKLEGQIEAFEVLGRKRYNTAVFCPIALATRSHRQNGL